MAVVLIYDQCGEAEISFAVVDDSWQKYAGLYINRVYKGEQKKLQSELSDLIYDEEGEFKIKFKPVFPHRAVVNGAKVITVGFVP